VLLFSRNKDREIQSFMLKMANNNCPGLMAMAEGPRTECRANLTLVVLIVPLENNKPLVDRMFAAVTKEVSTVGASLVLHEPRALDEMIVGFRFEGSMHYIRAKAEHLNPMGAGFYQLGVRMKEMVYVGDCPALATVSF
jgi:hypothetical protein